MKFRVEHLPSTYKILIKFPVLQKRKGEKKQEKKDKEKKIRSN